mmetsp:Transcript_30431/g.81031  ORF Transcript_30431/g.81031 Transcript_30431/m.81031 type:complete len:218 (+) Transcript_30431:339-992(+)
MSVCRRNGVRGDSTSTARDDPIDSTRLSIELVVRVACEDKVNIVRHGGDKRCHARAREVRHNNTPVCARLSQTFAQHIKAATPHFVEERLARVGTDVITRLVLPVSETTATDVVTCVDGRTVSVEEVALQEEQVHREPLILNSCRPVHGWHQPQRASEKLRRPGPIDLLIPSIVELHSAKVMVAQARKKRFSVEARSTVHHHVVPNELPCDVPVRLP